jgi:hypothetical protein
MIYLIGSMRNPEVPILANKLRLKGFDIFDDWYSPGKNADDEWQAYEKQRGRTYKQALQGEHAKDVFDFDHRNLDLSDAAVLLLPAGKSAHLELGYIRGCRKPGFIYIPYEPDRFDVMYKFASDVVVNYEQLLEALHRISKTSPKWEREYEIKCPA